jgi:HK97 family phage major capsid protein
MDHKELYRKARELYQKAAASEDVEEQKNLSEQADELVNRAKIAEKAAGLPEFDDEPVVPIKKTKDLERTMVEQGYSEQEIKNVLAAMNTERAPKIATPGKESTFTDFLKAVRFQDRQALKAMGATKDLVEGTGSDGGYLVPPQHINELLMVEGSEAVVRPRARIIPMSGRSVTMPLLDQGDTPAAYWKLQYYGGVLSHWTEEAGAKTETEPDFKQIELVAHKLAGYTQASDELLEDSGIGLPSLLVELFRGAINMREDFAFLRGTGVGQPLGILNSGVLLTQARATANTIEYRDLARMMDQFLPSAYSEAVWCIDVTALPELLTMEDTAGNNVFIPNATGGIAQAMPGTIFGRPVIVTEKLPALGNTGDVLLANFKYYLIGDRRRTSIDSSIHYAFINDLTTWRFVHRVDGQPWLDSPIYIDTTNQVSPFVALHADTTT